MKKLLMIAALLALATPAQADQLPVVYLRHWCVIPKDKDSVPTPGYQSYFASEPGDKCERADRLTIKQNELTAIESDCRFRSVKRTKDLRPNHTKATNADWTPVMEVLADCEGAGVKSVVKMRLIYEKGALLIEHQSAASAQSDRQNEILTCGGILHLDKSRLYVGSLKAEIAEDLPCFITQSEVKKVLSVCAVGRWCELAGVIDDCEPGKCEISKVTSVSRKRKREP